MKNRTDFKNGSMGAYCKAVDSKWLDEACAHMTPVLEAWPFDRIVAISPTLAATLWQWLATLIALRTCVGSDPAQRCV